MSQHQERVCRQGLVCHADEAGPWQQEVVQSAEDIAQVIGIITAAAMATAGFTEQEIFRLRLALEEALVNAHKHGHQGDWTKPIRVRYHVSDNGVAAEIEDLGMGFDPAQVPDPLAPENLERSSGRGLFLIRSYMSHVCHNEQGNRICLCKLCPEVSNRS
jgi:serine/threonine-protein kinase RsbW